MWPLGLARRGAPGLCAAPRRHHLARPKTTARPSFKLEHLTRRQRPGARGRARCAVGRARHHGAGAADAPAQPPAVRLCACGCTKKTAWLPSCACPRGGRRAALFARLGHVPCRARLHGRDVAPGQPPHQQERTDRLGPGARPRRTGHCWTWSNCASACSRAGRPARGRPRLPVKTIHLNKSPMVVGNLNTLTPALAQRWGIDMDLAAGARTPWPATCRT
jgi:hypothetical protein